MIVPTAQFTKKKVNKKWKRLVNSMSTSWHFFLNEIIKQYLKIIQRLLNEEKNGFINFPQFNYYQASLPEN